VLAAPWGNPYWRGYASPGQLADAVEASLAKDPSGTAVVNPERCKRDGSCATADDYLVTLRESQPEARSRLSSVADLPAYLRSLVSVEAPKGKYWMAMLKFSSSAKTHWRPVLHGLVRHFKPGEHAWMDPATKRLVFAEDCTNPIEKPEVPEPCVEIHFFTKPGDTGVRFKEYGPTDLADEKECTPALKRAGEQDFEYPWEDECPSQWCTFKDIDARVPEKGWRMGSYRPAAGEHVLRLPRKVAEKDSPYRVVFCIERTDVADPMVGLPSLEAMSHAYGFIVGVGAYDRHLFEYNEQARLWNARAEAWNALHSCGMGVQWSDYLPRNDGRKVATIYYDQEGAMDAQAQDVRGNPTLLWWRFDRTLCPSN
jgi:hypothetical protein